jgi:transcription antitermination protein NusB
MTDKSNKPKKGGPRSAARLGAVQALYQLDMAEKPNVKIVINEFSNHRLGKEIEGDQYANADITLFSDIVDGAFERLEDIDTNIKKYLTPDWPLDRVEKLLRAILRAGCYEIIARPDVPTPVIINEYVDVAHAFYDRIETSFVNGILDKLARELRS